MELRFDAMMYSNLGMEILMRVMPNVHAGRIWPAGRRFLTPALKNRVCNRVNFGNIAKLYSKRNHASFCFVK